jgi:hypothetical protein
MKVMIVVIEQHWTQLRKCLFPAGDDDEHFGFGLTGISRSDELCRLLLRKFVLADSSCLVKQSGFSVKPDPRFVDYVWALAKQSRSGLIDFHTHPFSDTHVGFSGIDDQSELKSFPEVVEYLGSGPHASVVLGRRSLDARWYDAQTATIKPISLVRMLGDNMRTIVPSSADPQTALAPACI